jgi:hypothetical protein
MKYGIIDQETRKHLSKTNSFTSTESEFLRTDRKHAEWLHQQFEEEGEYSVEMVEL